MTAVALSPSSRWISALRFDGGGLHGLRSLVADEARAAGLSEERVGDFVLAANEVGTNSVVHGGGSGTARIWREPGALWLEVRDPGRFSQLPIPDRCPDPTQEHGRGLWIVDRLCAAVRIRSGAGGTSVRLQMLIA